MSTQTQAKKILGVDPGYDRLGLAVVQNTTLLFSDCIETDKKDSHADRLGAIGTAFEHVLTEHMPDCVAVEKLFWGKNHKTALAVAESRGVILSLAARHGVSVHEYSPADVKIAVTGYGRSTKDQIMSMVPKIVTIEKEIRLDDEYDAIAVALTCEAMERLN